MKLASFEEVSNNNLNTLKFLNIVIEQWTSIDSLLFWPLQLQA